MPDAGTEREAVRTFARRRRLASAGLWLVVAVIVAALTVHALDAAFAGAVLWAVLLAPAIGYLLLLWRCCRCPVCGAPLLLDCGPYQRLVFNFRAKRCPNCGAALV